MISIKDIGAAGTKWVRNAAAGATSYTEGVQRTQADQAALAAAAKDQWLAGVQAAAGRNAFAKGLQDAGTDHWRRMSIDKGGSRFGQGVSVAQPLYQSGAAKYFDIIRNLTLPPRQTTGSPGNIQRVAAVASALRAAKTGGK